MKGLNEEHERDSQNPDNANEIVIAPKQGRGLIHHDQQWSRLHSKQMQLWRAKGEAEAAAALFSAKHNALANEISAQKKGAVDGSAPSGTATGNNPAAGKNATEFSAEKSASMLQLARSRSQNQKALATFDKRVDDQTQLAGVYGKWIGIVAGKQRAAVNYALVKSGK